jgi:hypothetical protein
LIDDAPPGERSQAKNLPPTAGARRAKGIPMEIAVSSRNLRRIYPFKRLEEMRHGLLQVSSIFPICGVP